MELVPRKKVSHKMASMSITEKPLDGIVLKLEEQLSPVSAINMYLLTRI